jgi:hypothetical protein
MSVFIFIIIIVGLVTCGEVLTKWLDRGGSQPQVGPGNEAEIAHLREQEQRFMTRLLEDRPEATPLPEHRESKEPS